MHLGFDRGLLDQQPKRHGPRLARQLVVRVWVQIYKGTQLEVAQALSVPASLVSRWHSRAMELMDRHNDLFEEIVESLDQFDKKRAASTSKDSDVSRHSRMSVNVEFVEEPVKLVLPPRKRSR